MALDSVVKIWEKKTLASLMPKRTKSVLLPKNFSKDLPVNLNDRLKVKTVRTRFAALKLVNIQLQNLWALGLYLLSLDLLFLSSAYGSTLSASLNKIFLVSIMVYLQRKAVGELEDNWQYIFYSLLCIIIVHSQHYSSTAKSMIITLHFFINRQDTDFM